MADTLKFTEDHIWVRVTGTRARIGLSDYLQEELGEIIGVELPDIGDELEKDESFGEIESIQTVSDLLAPVSGVVTAVNEDLDDQIGLLNDDPYQDGWLLEVKLADPDEVDDLMEREEYEEFVGQYEDDENGQDEAEDGDEAEDDQEEPEEEEP